MPCVQRHYLALIGWLFCCGITNSHCKQSRRAGSTSGLFLSMSMSLLFSRSKDLAYTSLRILDFDSSSTQLTSVAVLIYVCINI